MAANPFAGRFKVYGAAVDSSWCCTGTGMENHARYGAEAYTHAGGTTLDVNLFLAGELTWKSRGIVLRQETTFPESDQTKITLKLHQPTPLKLRIRVPGWAARGIDTTGAVTVHGEPGSEFVAIDRTWVNGDVLNVRLPMERACSFFRGFL